MKEVAKIADAIIASTGTDALTALAVVACMRGLSTGWTPPGYSAREVGNPGEELTEHCFVGPTGTYIENF